MNHGRKIGKRTKAKVLVFKHSKSSNNIVIKSSKWVESKHYEKTNKMYQYISQACQDHIQRGCGNLLEGMKFLQVFVSRYVVSEKGS
jgi:hypothetical protein